MYIASISILKLCVIVMIVLFHTHSFLYFEARKCKDLSRITFIHSFSYVRNLLATDSL